MITALLAMMSSFIGMICGVAIISCFYDSEDIQEWCERMQEWRGHNN